MVKSMDDNQAFKEHFFQFLQKTSVFTKRETFALWALISTIVDTRSFSLSEVSRRFGRQVGRNLLGNVLKKYSYVQRMFAQHLVQTIYDQIGPRSKIYLIADDTLVRKSGLKIFSTRTWYDSSRGYTVRALCLVMVAVVVTDQVLAVLPWLLVKPSLSKNHVATRPVNQDAKTAAAITMFEQLIGWLTRYPKDFRRIVILADSWFSSQQMLTWCRQLGVKFRIDGKKSYRVQLPDNEAIKKAQTQRRGRKRTRFTTSLRLEHYCGPPRNWPYFTDAKTGKRVYWYTATVTLVTSGRVRVYAFRRAGSRSPKFILTNATYLRPPTPQTIYRDYAVRWRIEEAFKDLKQHFGLEQCHCRDGWVVTGFFGVLTLAYSLLKTTFARLQHATEVPFLCPTWADQFHKAQIIELAERGS
jgi:hypothetical protein